MLAGLGKGGQVYSPEMHYTGGSTSSLVSVPPEDLELAKESERHLRGALLARLGKEVTARHCNPHYHPNSHRASNNFSSNGDEELINHQSLQNFQIAPSSSRYGEEEHYTESNFQDPTARDQNYMAGESQEDPYFNSEGQANQNAGCDTERELMRKRAQATTHSFGGQNTLGQQQMQAALESEAQKELSRKD